MPSALKTLTTEGRSPSGEAERPYREIAVVIIVKVWHVLDRLTFLTLCR